MKKIAAISLAAIVAVTGAVSTASAALTDREGSTWRPVAGLEVAGRGDRDRDRDRDARDRFRDRIHRGNQDDEFWRLRHRRHHRPFFLFHRDRGEYCFIKKMRVVDDLGNVVIKRVRVCE